MPTAGESHVDELQRDIACPSCEYNLRGLRGAVVSCPECGASCDVVELVKRRWTRPWFYAPGLERLTTPVAWSMVGLLLGLFVLMPVGLVTKIFACMIWVGVMVFTWYRAWQLLGGPEGLLLAALAHVLVVGYLGGIMAVVAGVFGMLDMGWSVWLAAWVALAIVGVVAIYLSRRGERFIAGRCIGRYLNKPPVE